MVLGSKGCSRPAAVFLPDALRDLTPVSHSTQPASMFLFQTDPPDGVLFGAPGATVGYGYTIGNPDLAVWLTSAGLYQIDIDVSSPPEYVNSGAFVLSGDFYTGDPFSGGEFVASADDQIAAYQVTATREPRLLWTTGLGLATLLLGASVRRRISGRPAARSSTRGRSLLAELYS